MQQLGPKQLALTKEETESKPSGFLDGCSNKNSALFACAKTITNKQLLNGSVKPSSVCTREIISI